MTRGEPRFRIPTRAILAAVVLLTGAVVGCRGTVPIGDLLAEPGRYDGETVGVEGRVHETVGALGYGAFRIRDDTGTLSVISRSGGAPAEGAYVGVEGTFHSVFTFGGRSEAVLEAEDRFDP
ncbi:MAG: hypothetical protein R3326_09780 [Gemmatimonadota bacterium]|nr:hypothetical protein [Gemmatimonadota bacterium]